MSFCIIIIKCLLVAIPAVDFDEASVDEGVVDAEAEGVHDLVDAGEAVDGGLAMFYGV